MPKNPELNSYNVLLSDKHYQMLQDTATATSTNMSIIVRQAIVSYHQMKVLGIPICADGQPCRVPNVFPVAPQLPQGSPS